MLLSAPDREKDRLRTFLDTLCNLLQGHVLQPDLLHSVASFANSR